MRWWFTRTKPPNEMAVFSGIFFKKICHVDGIVRNTFQIHAKWEIILLLTLLWEKTPLSNTNFCERQSL